LTISLLERGGDGRIGWAGHEMGVGSAVAVQASICSTTRAWRVARLLGRARSAPSCQRPGGSCVRRIAHGDKPACRLHTIPNLAAAGQIAE
jgi:hypothetical protein